jgi:Na+:H+ antiporter, NhaA family
LSYFSEQLAAPSTLRAKKLASSLTEPLVNGVILRASSTSLKTFFRLETASGILLFICATAALLWSNSPIQESYSALWKSSFLGWTIIHWINEGLMSVFFYVVGLEIKRELLAGELSSRKKATLPLVAALGGMLAPGVIYWQLNGAGEAREGWGIPIATDIAFALSALRLAGRGTAPGLKVFLTALAIADDLGAVLVVTFFYSAASGIHGSTLGVGLAALTPLALGSRMERTLLPWVSFGIMPLFALANAGVAIRSTSLLHPVSTGIIAGLLIGKPAGIFLSSWLATRLGLAQLPKGVSWQQLLGVAALGGIGFTMSLFIADIAFQGTSHLELAKISILTGSVLSGVLGFVLLRTARARPRKPLTPEQRL